MCIPARYPHRVYSHVLAIWLQFIDGKLTLLSKECGSNRQLFSQFACVVQQSTIVLRFDYSC